MTEKEVSKNNMAKKEKKKNSLLKNLSKNYWAISTVVLALALIATLIIPHGNVSGAVIGADIAGQKVVDFVNKQGANAELISASDDGSLYEVIISIQGRETPVYVTKDGGNLIPVDGLIPLEEDREESSPSNPQTPEVVKSDKPVVEAFVMSHCPYGTQIEKGLVPVMKLLGDKIDAEIKFVYYAMHPTAGEVEEQLNEYCIQKEQNDKFLDYLICFLGKTGSPADGISCLDEVGIDKARLSSCVTATDKEFNVLANLEDKSSWLSGRFPKFDIHKAENDKYDIKGSPALVINGKQVQAGRDSISLLNAICAAFNEAPEECEFEFDAVSPTPGFGLSTTTTANNAAATATCG